MKCCHPADCQAFSIAHHFLDRQDLGYSAGNRGNPPSGVAAPQTKIAPSTFVRLPATDTWYAEGVASQREEFDECWAR